METINVQKRDFNLKAKKMRRLGLVPGDVFGSSLPESISIQMEETVARKLIRLKREGSKVMMNIDGKTLPVQIKEKSLNAVNNEILHISFQALTADEKVNSVIHIIVINDDKIAGILERIHLEIPYASLPKDMIDTITIDVDGMKAGAVLTVGEIPELNSDKIELQVDPDSIVLRVSERISHATTAVEG
ncbi:50S ribosomal protein L25/general stress protein Ctc [Terrisporobacter petrolearius]|uniref:50S ribosomal protein L25/general stress protein Ctc n=1 Tax=Terrisporobacter petrolearius TaxID=1460447 RepID=UPI001D16B7ED|nr:50S ribosomal protein L25/general stress protein Ctc [Terrisporobacter petrolearius]MCC3866399.1 50S ribosomal protein L25/general stress protein Ctc [Terrisporobacter petrolearius]